MKPSRLLVCSSLIIAVLGGCKARHTRSRAGGSDVTKAGASASKTIGVARNGTIAKKVGLTDMESALVVPGRVIIRTPSSGTQTPPLNVVLKYLNADESEGVTAAEMIKPSTAAISSGAVFSVVSIPALSSGDQSLVTRTIEVIRFINEESAGTAFADFYLTLCSAANDPFYLSTGSWGQPYSDLWGLGKLKIESAWLKAKGNGVTVAVVDSGVDASHEDLTGQVLIGRSFVRSTDGSTMDESDTLDNIGHGTQIAGIIAAVTNNGIGIAGVAPMSKILPVKVVGDAGLASASDLAQGIIYAADKNAKVINVSVGDQIGRESIPLYLSEAIEYANGVGSVVVTAAGNGSATVKGFYPASDPNTLSVAATTSLDEVSFFSNSGLRLGVSAPGGGDSNPSDPFDIEYWYSILSLSSSTLSYTTPLLNGPYIRGAGTSLSSAYVSGVAALVAGAHPDWNPGQVRQAISSSADDIADPGFDRFSGPGRVNAANALNVASPLAVAFGTDLDGAFPTSSVAIRGEVSGAGLKSWSLNYRVDGEASWTQIATGTGAVQRGGLLSQWTIPADMGGRDIELRLTAIDMSGKSYQVYQDASIRLAVGLLIAAQNNVIFGSVAVGTTQTQTIQVTNAGLGPVVFAGVQLDSEVFWEVTGTTPGEGGRCNGTIAPRQTCNIVVSYKPSSIGATSEINLAITYTQTGSQDLLAEIVTLSGIGMDGTGKFPWQNPKNKLDVDNNGFVNPIDALVIINDLNSKQARVLPPAGPEPGNYYLDVNADGYVSPLDVLNIINYLNSAR